MTAANAIGDVTVTMTGGHAAEFRLMHQTYTTYLMLWRKSVSDPASPAGVLDIEDLDGTIYAFQAGLILSMTFRPDEGMTIR